MALAGKLWQPYQIAELLYSRGWRDENLLTMIAIVLAESLGYEEAEGHNPATDTRPESFDWGLFQLNSEGDGVTKSMAFDPLKAVEHARLLYLRRHFQPWAAYNSGAYKKKGAGFNYQLRAIEGTRNFWRKKYGYGLAG